MKPAHPTALSLLTAALITAACAATAYPYQVYFKNGSTMEVRSHRVAGDRVFLRVQSGEAAFDKAQIDMDRTLAEYASTRQVLKKAAGLSDGGDYEGAVKLYQGLLAGDADDVEVRYLLGKALIGAKRYDEASHELLRVRDTDPAWPGVRTRMGDIYFRQGSYNDAIDQYLLALDEDPKDKEAHLGLGMCYARQEMYEGGLTELYKAIELRPDYAQAYAMLGYIYYKKAEFDRSESTLRKAIDLDSSLPEAHYYMGLLYGVLGVESDDSKKQRDYFDKSIEEFRRAVTLRRDYPEAHADLGVAFYKRGSVVRAVEEFKLAISQKPDMAVAHNNLAGIYLRQGYYDEAVSESKKAAAIDPHMVDAYFVMGNAYANMKKFREAVKAYDRYLYYSPEGDLADEVRQRRDRVLQEGGLVEKPGSAGKAAPPPE